jgi:hypothetical protein
MYQGPMWELWAAARRTDYDREAIGYQRRRAARQAGYPPPATLWPLLWLGQHLIAAAHMLRRTPYAAAPRVEDPVPGRGHEPDRSSAFANEHSLRAERGLSQTALVDRRTP